MPEAPAQAEGSPLQGSLPSFDETAGPFYLRPLALLRGWQAREAVAAGAALALAGGRLAFAAAELSRRTPAGIDRRVVPAPVLAEWSRTRPALHRRLAALAAPSPDWPSLSAAPDGRPLVMGILNVTPDSFSDGGRYLDPPAALAHARAMAAAGADIIDVGGESTRPGAPPVAPETELARVVPVVRVLAAEGLRVSIDTRHAAVMQAALEAGAGMINDISALSGDPQSLPVAARASVPVVLMHMQGDPTTMQRAPSYVDAPLDVFDWLAHRIEVCAAAGLAPERLVVDPGIGFGKTPAHNLALLEALPMFLGLGCPLLVGASRKSFIAAVAGTAPASARLGGSLAAALQAAGSGACVIRVHDVAETVQALRIDAAIHG